jgi:hypothetical protein
MIVIRRLLLIVGFISIVSAGSAFGSATNIYITQNGSPSGNCTANVQTPAFVTNAANWGTGGSQIGAGTTVLFCGTFTLPAGASLASFLGSGNSTSPITFKLDTGAIIQSVAMGSASAGAFNCSGKSYVTVDGGTNGIIQNTSNGTGLANSQASQGLYFSGCTNAVITGLTIQNIYQNQGSRAGASDTNGENTADVYLTGNSTGSQISNNTLNNARTGVLISFDSGADASNDAIFGNTISDHGWAIAIGADYAASTAAGVVIHDNNISNWTNWQFPSSSYHTDGIILFNDVTGGAYQTYSIYNNYFSGSLGNGSATGYIACGLMSTCTIFNNLMVDTGTTPCYGYIWLYTPNGPDSVYNNTLVGSSASSNIAVTLGDPGPGPGPTRSALTVNNNIFINIATGLHDYQTLTSDVAASDRNVLRNGSGTAPYMSTNDSKSIAFAAWQDDGFDANSLNSNPNLTASYTLNSGSPAIGLGANLTTLEMAALDMDKAGVHRPPPSAKWDAGAYAASGSSPVAPPTGLTAAVH